MGATRWPSRVGVTICGFVLVSLAFAAATAAGAYPSGGLVARVTGAGTVAVRMDGGAVKSTRSTEAPLLAPLKLAGKKLSPRALAGRRLPVTILLTLRNARETESLVNELTRFQGRIKVIRQIGVVAVTTRRATELAAWARHDTRVLSSELERRLTALADPFDTIDGATGMNFQWAYDAVRAGEALVFAGGGSVAPVAVIDTGVEVTHPDLAGRVARTYWALVGGTDVTDYVGHGTFGAGLISAIDGNGVGIKGIAGATPLYAVRASIDGSFLVSSVVDGIVWAVDNGVKVINLSLGGQCPSPDAELAAINYAFSKDVLVVAAAGNSGGAGNPLVCPAWHIGGTNGGPSQGLSVGALRPDSLPAPFSTFNDGVSLAAPGAAQAGDCRYGVFSTIPVSVGITSWDGATCSVVYGTPYSNTGRWAYGEGTSFAAPIVSGVAALVRGVNPSLRYHQVATLLKRTARQTLGAGWNAQTGWGIVDSAAAVSQASRFDTQPPTVGLSLEPQPLLLFLNAAAQDTAGPGQDIAPGSAVMWTEMSYDDVNWTELTPASSDPVEAVYRFEPNTQVWVRAISCDSNLNCWQVTDGPVVIARDEPSVRLSVEAIKKRWIDLKIRIDGSDYVTDLGRVDIQYWAGRRYRTFKTVRVPYNGTKRTLAVARTPGRYELRAVLKQGRAWNAVTSNSVYPRITRGR